MLTGGPTLNFWWFLGPRCWVYPAGLQRSAVPQLSTNRKKHTHTRVVPGLPTGVTPGFNHCRGSCGEHSLVLKKLLERHRTLFRLSIWQRGDRHQTARFGHNKIISWKSATIGNIRQHSAKFGNILPGLAMPTLAVRVPKTTGHFSLLCSLPQLVCRLLPY